MYELSGNSGENFHPAVMTLKFEQFDYLIYRTNRTTVTLTFTQRNTSSLLIIIHLQGSQSYTFMTQTLPSSNQSQMEVSTKKDPLILVEMVLIS
jgi:hypothetical protein